jgi:hypothetical protein
MGGRNGSQRAQCTGPRGEIDVKKEQKSSRAEEQKKEGRDGEDEDGR